MAQDLLYVYFRLRTAHGFCKKDLGFKVRISRAIVGFREWITWGIVD